MQQSLHGRIYAKNYEYIKDQTQSIISQILDVDDNIKIADFGLASEFSGIDLFSKCGTKSYQAPEIHMKQGYNQRVDVWVCVIFETRPFYKWKF